MEGRTPDGQEEDKGPRTGTWRGWDPGGTWKDNTPRDAWRDRSRRDTWSGWDAGEVGL